MRPFRRPRDPRRQCPRRHAGMDEDAPGARRPAFAVGAGGHLQLRHARAGPSVARVRPGQDPGRPVGALGPRRRDAGTPERPDRHAGFQGRRSGGRRHRRKPGRHHGRRSHVRDAGHAEHLPGSRVLVAAVAGRPRAPLQVQFGSQPSRRTRRGLRHDSRAHRIHHAPDRRHLRRPGRSAGRPDRQPAQARTRAHAPGALPSRAGRAGDAGRRRPHLRQPGPGIHH